jgi:predicted dehydrogenase
MRRISEKIGRRDFMRVAGIASLGISAVSTISAAPISPVDPHSPKTGKLVKDKKPIRLAIIGVGGMGSGHLGDLLKMQKENRKIEVRAISDVYERRKQQAAKRAKESTGKKIETYTDYKALLDRDDIDGVVVATPDHWHAQISMDAMDAGKDVYCQKPVTLTIEESLAVRAKVYETGRIFQCGAQRCSDDFFWQARDFIKKGGIGEVLYAQLDYSRNSGSPESPQGGEWNYTIQPEATDDPNAGENYIDWEQWLGSAPKRPFSKPRFFQFRKYWDYSGGIATDLWYHQLAPLTIALDASAPEKAVAGGGIYVQKDDREVPDTFLATLDYPGGYSILMTSSMANANANPLMIRGHRATITRGEKGEVHVVPEKEFAGWFKKEFGADVLDIPKQPRLGHMEKWLDCIKSRDEVHLNAEFAYRAQAGTKMACDSYRQEKAIFWDPVNEHYADTHPRPNRDTKVTKTPS